MYVQQEIVNFLRVYKNNFDPISIGDFLGEGGTVDLFSRCIWALDMYVCMCRGEPAGGGVLVSDSLPLHESGVLRGDGAGAGATVVPHRVRTPPFFADIHTYTCVM